MEHLLAVGKITAAARADIERGGGRITHVSSTPPVLLVTLPGLGMEYMDNDTEMRLKIQGRIPLIWRGHYPGPWFTSIDQTELRSEHEPIEEAIASGDDSLGDLNEHSF